MKTVKQNPNDWENIEASKQIIPRNIKKHNLKHGQHDT